MSSPETTTSDLMMISSPCQGKRVSFSAEPPSFHTYSMDVDKDERWWQSHDFDEIKTSIKAVIKNTKKNDSAFVGITGVYKFAEMAASNVMDEEKLARALNKVKVDPLLTLWCTSTTGRGLESLLRRKFTERTSSMARASYMALVITWQGVITDEDLRRKCLGISRQDRILARMMGEADAIAVLEAQQNVDKLSIDKSKMPAPVRILGRLQAPMRKRIWIPQTA